MNDRGIAIIGGGALGSAWAVNLAKRLRVSLLVRSQEVADAITAAGENIRYLPNVAIPSDVTVTVDWDEALANCELILIATPANAFGEVLANVDLRCRKIPVVWCSKGFCPVSGEPLSLEAERILGPDACYGVLSGPSFAEGIAANDPTAVVVATNSGHQRTLGIAEFLSNESLRVYANSDLIGVQVCGVIKNVYAIAAGIIDGCGWGVNTRAAMVTRAIAEAKRYLESYPSMESTLMGLAGFGDIYLTCSSRVSRNYQVGLGLASGKPLAVIVEGLGHVAEGIHSARLIHKRATGLGIDMPLVAAVNAVLDGVHTPRECATALMARDVKYEKSLISDDD
ncbi:MAG: NAD(P)H-dependent glycerol-3-phosphate dehydrogenase [Verrucomicrobiota bacterium]